MKLFPTSLFIQKLDLEALVAVFLRSIYVVRDTSRTLLEDICKNRIYTQAGVLLRPRLLVLINDPDIVFRIHMGKVTAFRMHLHPYAVRLAVTHFCAGLYASLSQQGLYL